MLTLYEPVQLLPKMEPPKEQRHWSGEWLSCLCWNASMAGIDESPAKWSCKMVEAETSQTWNLIHEPTVCHGPKKDSLVPDITSATVGRQPLQTTSLQGLLCYWAWTKLLWKRESFVINDRLSWKIEKVRVTIAASKWMPLPKHFT